MLQLSNRLRAVADFVTTGNRVVDVGTDHGYVPIYLIEAHIVPSALAMDVNKGPVERARENINQYGLQSYISVRLSDGLSKLQKDEGDTLIIAGMGGSLTIRILMEGMERLKDFSEVILEPQSDIQKVRRFLREHGMKIIAENLILEDGKYYPILKAVFEEENENHLENRADFLLEDWYGPCLLKEKHPVLKMFLKREEEQIKCVLCKLKDSADSESKQIRVEELKNKQLRNQQAQKRGCV